MSITAFHDISAFSSGVRSTTFRRKNLNFPHSLEKMASFRGWKEGRALVPQAKCNVLFDFYGYRCFIFLTSAKMVADKHAMYLGVHADTAQSRPSRFVGQEHSNPTLCIERSRSCFLSCTGTLTGTMNTSKSSVAASGGIVLLRSSG